MFARSRLLLGVTAVTSALTAVAPVGGAQETVGPKLIVVVVVDQLRADYLTLYNEHWKSGFRLLLDQGAVFEQADYPYHNTVTCAGHATIGTGALPRTHGMVLNGWWHRHERRTLECTEDPSSPDITYGRPVKSGNSPKRLLVPTLADELRSQKPGSRVVSISLKARGAINLAGHGGDIVTWFDEIAGSFATSRAFTPKRVEVMREFIARDPFERDQGRVWVLRDPPATYKQRDAGVGERPPAPWTGLFPHRVAGRAPLDAAFFDVWQVSPFADAYLQRMAAAMIDSLDLGQRNATDFLGVSLSSLDEVGHLFGPESRETEDMLRQLDVTLGALIEKLDKSVGRANYVLALSADHGVASIAKPGTGKIAPEDVRDRIEETLIAHFGPLQKGTYVDAVNYQYVYFAPGVFDRLRASAEALRLVEEAILDIPGVSRVLRGDRLSDTSTDRIVRAAAFSYAPERSGDLIIVSKENWMINLRNTGAAATHGSPYSYDTHVPVIMLGHGIKPGRVRNEITPADIAPTLAQIAGVRMPKADGRVLRDALK